MQMHYASEQVSPQQYRGMKPIPAPHDIAQPRHISQGRRRYRSWQILVASLLVLETLRQFSIA